MTVTIDARYNGPPGSANGGYTCGVVAALVGGPAEVTLRRPPPLGRPLEVDRADGRVALLDGGELVAEGVPAEIELDVPAPVSFAEAERASAAYPGFVEHPFPTCFVCGPGRPADDGLRIFPGPVAGRELVASPWVAPAARAELVWAALDCPGGFAAGLGTERGEMVLGRLGARIERAPEAGERCIVVAWPLGEDGRKVYAGTALFAEEGELLGRARATWIAPA
jgi:hypothetical protein